VRQTFIRDGRHCPQECRSQTLANAPELPISCTLRIRGMRQNASTDHLRQNVGPSRRGAKYRTAPLAPAGDPP
jgi:hypothetical protein